jgi:hypothetical protein
MGNPPEIKGEKKGAPLFPHVILVKRRHPVVS